MGVNDGFHYPVMFYIVDSLVNLMQSIAAGHKFFPSEAVMVLRHDLD